jgi:sugar phosphate permease
MLSGEEISMHDAMGAVPLSVPAGANASRRWAVTGMLLVAVTIAFFDRINIAVLFTDKGFQSAIGVSDPALMGLLMTAFFFSYGASAILFSGSGDLFGPRRTLSTIAAILALTMAFMGSVSSYALLIAARILLGMAEGPQFGTATATVKRWFPRREQGLANALWSIGSPLGSMLGFPLAIFLVAQFGWRASFYVLGGLNAFVVLPLVWTFLRDRPATPPEDSVPQAKQASFIEGFREFAGNWQFWMLSLYNCGTLIYLWGLNSWLPTYLQQARHFDLLHTGFYSSLPFLLMMAGELFWGLLSDRLGRRAIICFTAQFLAGALVLLAALVPGAVTAAWCIAWSAFCWGGTTPTLFALGAQIVSPRVTAAGFGVYAGIANVVGSSAPFVIGAILGSTGNFALGLEFLVACCMISSFAMLPLARKF